MNPIKLSRLLLAIAVLPVWTGCASSGSIAEISVGGPAQRADKAATDPDQGSPKIVLAHPDGLVGIDWNGLALPALIDGVGQVTGRVFVYDRRQVELKPCVSFSRPIDVPVEAIYALFESVLASLQLACVQKTFRLTPVSSWEVIRIVPRAEGKGSIPVLLGERSDLFEARDIPWFAIVGPTGPASIVRSALAKTLKPSDRPSPVLLSPALLRARYGCSAHSTGRAGHFDPNLCDLYIFNSPYPCCVR